MSLCFFTNSQPMCAKKKPRVALWGSASVCRAREGEGGSDRERDREKEKQLEKERERGREK
jgi:hypothetical protein